MHLDYKFKAENPIEVDRNAPQHRQAQVGQAANGVTLVNIAGPTAGGVSRNDYTNFNVPQNGVILNNSYQMANTSLAGYVPGNANMMRGSASVIVNEVTSHNPTNMNGFIEVAGRKASVVVANPNGITVDGGGFINTDRAVLTTGKPEYDPNGNLNTYRVEQGSIAINGKGLNAKESNSLQILTEAAQVNAGVWANAVETRTGKNIIDAKSLESKALGSSNQIGLDVSAIGGMYANSITMKGTNDGLGVNVKGTLSSVHATNISADGMIQVDGGITSNGQTSISGHAISVGQDGVVQGDNGLAIESQSSMTNHGLVNSNGTTDIRAKSVDNAENGRIYGNTLSIKADIVSNHTDATIETKYKRAADALTQAKEALDTEWNADITAYKSKEELQAHRNRIQELTKAYDKAQEAMTKVQKELDSHKSGTIASRDHMDIQANEIHNNGNALLYSGNTMNLIGSHVIENKGATIQSGGEMTLTTSNLVNDNASFGMKRVSDGITKHGDKLKVDDKNHPEENQIFDVSEFPGYTGKGGYGVAHIVPVKQSDGTIKMVDKGVPPVKNFTLIRSEEEHTHTEVTNNQPGVISAGGNIVINGASSNINSKIASAGQVVFNGAHETVSDKTSDKVFKTGTTQVSEAKRVHKGHGLGHKWRRYWDPEVFMTPSIEEQNIQPIGTIQEHAEDTIAESNKRKVNDSLDPFGTGNQGKSSIGNVTIEGLKLPTQAIYNIHPDITANALIETDTAFTNRKKFVSSEYMLNALANDPERRMKRLGDGFYEQGLINSQILSATGKPYLEGHTDNESEYKALLEAGISYGKKYKLTPGITLSEEQMKAITTDMVWLETKTVVVNGQPQQVLYPKVYLAKQSANQIDAMGAVVSGKSIIANTDSAFKNSGNMMADSIVVQADTVDNTGRFNANTVAIGATDSIRNIGAIHGNDSVILRANNDISVEAETHQLANQDVLMQQGRIGVSNSKGTIDIHSNKDVHLTGAIITGGEDGNISITSVNTVNLDTKKLSAKKDMTLNAANYLRTDRGTEIGTQILGDGNVTVAAKNDVNIRQGVINSEHGATTIAAGNDVNIENGNTHSRDQYGLQYKEKGLLSRTVNTIRKDYEHTGVTASTIGGNTIQVGANHDVNVTGSNMLGTGDVVISAGNKVRTNSAEDSSRNDTYQHSKKKGLMGAGLGFTIGSKQIKDTEAESYTTNVNTLIGSVDGTIAINANNDAHITSTDIVGKHGITVSAADITLDGNHDVAMSKQVHEEKQSGLTVSLGGSIASALNTAHGLQHKASSRNDKRLATLENIEAGKELKKGYEQIKEYQEFTPEFVKRRAESLIDSSKIKKGYVAEIDKELKNPNLSDKEIRRLEKDRNRLEQEANQEHAEGTNDLQDINSKDQKQYNAKKRAKKDGLANIHVSIGSSKSRSETTLNSRNYAGGQLVSDEDIVLVAKPNMQDKGNIVAVGETIRGKSVTIDASKDISLLAGINTHENQAIYDSKSWSIGANLSVNGGGLLGLDANYNQGMERGNTLKTTHTGTVIQADQVNLHSGKDTTIAGSKVYGDSVTAEIGGNLAIKSLQDTETYRGKSKNVGFSVSTNGLQLGSVSAEYTNGTMKSDYASVTDQAGIYAGTGGFAIQSKGNTTLEGAVIGSKATADKNSLVTDSLTIKDIKNKAEYTSRNTGLSYTSVSGFKNLSQAGKDAVYNSLGLLPKLLPDSSKSSESTTKSAIANGTIKTQSSNIDIDKISRDTESSLNKLDTIFDKKKVEERQELARLFAKDAFEQLHYWKPKTKEEKVAKALAHAVVAESSARIAGNPAGSGFYAGLSNEALIGEIQKISKTNPAVAQWLSAALGAVVNGALVKPMVTGATEAQYGTKWNSYGLLIPKPLFGSLSRGMVTDMPGNISVMGEIHIEQATGESTSSSASDPSTPMDDVIPPGPEFSNSDVLQPPVVISTKKPILTDLPPKTDPYTGKVSIWNVEKQQYEEMDNLYKFNGKEAFDQGGSDEFGRAIFVEKESGQLIYGVNKSKVYLYRGSDGKPDWRIVSPDNKFVKIGKYDGSASEHLKTTLGDNNMLYNSNATVVFNASTHSLVNSNTGNALSKIGFKYFKNNISLDTISKNDLDNLQWDNDGITVMVKDKDSITDRIIFENMDSNGYKYSDKVINGYKTGVIEPGKVEPTEKPEFNLGVENLNFDNGLGGIVDSWNGVSIKGGVKANLAKINMREWSGYDFWGDTKASVFEGNIGGKVQINKSGLTLGANSGFNFVKLQPKYSYDMNGTKYKVESEFIYGFNAEGEGHIGYNGKGINVSGIIGKPTIGAGVNVKGGVENENGEITIYEYDSNKKNKSK